MVDHQAPLTPRSLGTGDGLASLHRELALNVPGGGPESALAGTAADPNAELRIRPPFPLSRLPRRMSG